MTEDSYLKDVEDKVFKVLVDHPETRENDTLLCFTYWSMFDDKRMNEIVYYITPESIKQLTPPDFITRMRRHWINTENCFGSEDTKDARKKTETQVKNFVLSEWARQE